MRRSITHDTLLTQSVGPAGLKTTPKIAVDCNGPWVMGQGPMERSATVFRGARFELLLAALAIRSPKHGACCVPWKHGCSVTYRTDYWHLFRCHRASVARLRLPAASLTPPNV